MADVAIEFPPGVTTLLSRAKKIQNWRDGNLVRWDDGVTLRPVGGWEQVDFSSTVFASKVRQMHRWIANNGILWTAYLCEQHLYVSSGGALIDITPVGGMPAPSGDAPGYGELNYSAENYGTPRSGTSSLQKFSAAWTLGNWGQNLLAMTSYDGRLLQWDPTSALGTKAAAVPTAPTLNRSFVVTPERHVMLFQMGGNQADIGWCSEEDINDWNFASTTNTAGEYTLDPFSPIVAAQVSDIGISVHTPAMSHFVDYVGLPYIYRKRPMGEIPIPISAASIAAIPEGIIWASVEGFWLFNGSVADVIPCPLWDSVAKVMDFGHTVGTSHMVHLHNRGEVWWFWCDPSINLNPNRYVGFDYRSKVWMPGYLERTCGLTYGNDRSPYMSDGYKVWKHETGFNYPGAVYMPFLESQTLNVQDGAKWVTLNKIIPDITGDASALAFSISQNNNRADYPSQKYTAQRIKNGYGYVDIRETARDIRLRIDMVKNSDWTTVGPIIFDLKQRGGR